jgi:hypothetical protein
LDYKFYINYHIKRSSRRILESVRRWSISIQDRR